MKFSSTHIPKALLVAERDLDLWDDDDDEGRDPERAPGAAPSRWVQYATRGTGYLPVHETHRTLPAGCYKLERADLYGRDVLIEPATLLADDVADFGDGPASEILSEIKEFWSLSAEYLRMGCVHKRGYLFWGPPGSGKSSLVAAIVRSHMLQDGVVLLVNKPDLLPSVLPRFRSVEPERPLLTIWEDLETSLEHGKAESDVLSMLDGSGQVNHIVFIATTNYPERLDSRLLNRPGRLDRIVKIGLPGPAARRRCFISRAGSAIGPGGEDLVAISEGLSYAHLRELVVGVFLRHQSAVDLAARLKRMRVTPKSGGQSGGFGFGEED